MRTVAIINQKGGCGKTTTSINLAACLARLGQKTLLVDMDPQGHCGVGLAVPEDQIERTVLEALIEDRDGKPAKLDEIVWQIATDFDLAPSNIKLAAFEQMFAGRPGREDRLLSIVQSVKNNYAWCIIDCPPSVGLITFNALRACDEVVVPVETGYFSLHGLTKMMETLEMMKEKANKDILIRVLPTLYDTRTKLAREVLSELRSKFSGYLMESTVNFNTKLKEAASFGQPITEYDPGSRGYKDFVNLARELMGHKPTETEATPNEALSRPAELVQRAKQLAQLTTMQFGRNAMAPNGGNGHANGNGVAEPLGGSPAAVASSLDNAQSRLQHMGIAAETASSLAITPTERKLADFYGVKQLGEEVVFAAKFAEARKVLIAGDFNNWSPMSTPMYSADRPGEWVTRLPLQPGRYRYRFVVDGKWMTDPHNAYVETNQFGEMNNVIEVD
jgi:chromosome partitioning protein